MAVMRQGGTKGHAGQYKVTPKNSTNEAGFTKITDRVKVVVVTLAIWGWFPVGLADRISRWGGSHHV